MPLPQRPDFEERAFEPACVATETLGAEPEDEACERDGDGDGVSLGSAGCCAPAFAAVRQPGLRWLFLRMEGSDKRCTGPALGEGVSATPTPPALGPGLVLLLQVLFLLSKEVVVARSP